MPKAITNSKNMKTEMLYQMIKCKIILDDTSAARLPALVTNGFLGSAESHDLVFIATLDLLRTI